MQMTLIREKIHLDFGRSLSKNSLEACLTKAYARLAATGNNFASFHMLFDLSGVRFFQIDCLIFLLCVLSYLKKRGVALRLLLPEKNGRWDFPKDRLEAESDERKTRKARDFLLRWKFEQALREALGSPIEVLPAHQEDYFTSPTFFYPQRTMVGQFGVRIPLLSCLLIEIEHMTRGPGGNKRVSEDEIKSFLRSLALEGRLIQAIQKAMNRQQDEYFAAEFCHSILWESLINTEEHPNATLSMVAMARDVTKRELIIAIADNGESIPETIMDAFKKSDRYQHILGQIRIQTRDSEIIDKLATVRDKSIIAQEYKQQAAALVYSTLKGTSRIITAAAKDYNIGIAEKYTPNERSRRGEGLYYVKKRTIEFGGSCYIRACGASLDVHSKNGTSQYFLHPVAPWPGNLLSIRLPILYD